MIIDIIVYSVLALTSMFLGGYIIVLRGRIGRLIGFHAQAMIDKQTLTQKLSDALTIIETKPVENTDGFLKYLETTRDSAFKFIETVQDAMEKFDSSTSTIFAKDEITSEDADTIKLAYLELKMATMPEDIPNN